MQVAPIFGAGVSLHFMLRRAWLTVAYDGTSFHGFAENDGVRTVMGE